MTQQDDSKRRPAWGLALGEDTEMNMTPMIDIVFQLIIFFVVTLKFKTIDQRIDAALPNTAGEREDMTRQEEAPKIRLKVFRKHKADPVLAYTLVKIDNTHRLRFPGGSWGHAAADDRAQIKAYEHALATLRDILLTKQRALGNGPNLYCEIVAAQPDGGAVPEGDVVRLIDTIVSIGVTDIRFEGTALPRRNR